MRKIFLILSAVLLLANFATSTNTVEKLPASKIKRGEAVLNVHVNRYEAGDSLIVKIGNFQPLAEQDFFNFSMPLDEYGNAKAEIQMDIPQLANARIGDYSLWIILTPDEEIDVTFDKEGDKLKLMNFSGYLAQTHTDFNTLKLPDNEDFGVEFMIKLKECSSSEERIKLLKAQLEEQKRITNQLDITDAAKAILRMSAEAEYLYWLNNFGGAFIGRQAYLDMMELPSPEEYGRIINETDSLLPAPPEGSIGVNEYFELLGAPYAPVMNEFYDYCVPEETYMGEDGNPNFNNRDIFLVHTIIEEGNPGSLLDSIRSEEGKDLVSQTLENQRNKAEALSQAENIYCHSLDDVVPENILKVILDKYKGKTVVIDLWETWCAPCLKAHKIMEPYKKDLKDENIVFVYLASPSSSLSLWESMIPEISGEHYYLTMDQVKYIQKHYDSQGVPTYALYDKTGVKTHSFVGFPGMDKMKSLIEETLKK